MYGQIRDEQLQQSDTQSQTQLHPFLATVVLRT